MNGRITRADDAVVPVFDHGFLYGEGVYETLRTYVRRPFLFDRHMARLRRSAAMIALDVPGDDAVDNRLRNGHFVHGTIPHAEGKLCSRYKD